MTDRRDALTLETGCRGQQCPRRRKENLLQVIFLHLPEQIAAQYGGGASASAGASVHILLFNVIEQHSTVLIVPAHINAVLLEELRHDLMPQNAQITSQHQIIVRRFGPGGLEVSGQSVISGGGRRSIRPIKFSRPLPARYALQANQGASGIRPDI